MYYLHEISAYYGMTIEEFITLIDGDLDKFLRFMYDYTYNHN